MSSRGPGSIPVAIARLGFADPARAKAPARRPGARRPHPRARAHRGARAGRGARRGARPRRRPARAGAVHGGRSPASPACAARSPPPSATPGPARQRLLAVLGSSAALGDHLCAHPEQWTAVTEATPLTVERAGAPARRRRDHAGTGAARRRAAHGVPRAAARHRGPRPHRTRPDVQCCPRRRRRSPTSRRPRSRRRWPSPATRWGRMPAAPASRSSRWARPAGAS